MQAVPPAGAAQTSSHSRSDAAGVIIATRLSCSAAMPRSPEMDAPRGTLRVMTGPTIAAAAPANDLTADRLRLRPGDDGVSLMVSPMSAGWRYLAYATRALGGGERMPFRLQSSEAVIVVLSGGGVTVEVNGRQPVELAGRRSVFDGLPWAIYLPPGTRGRIIGRPIRREGRTVIASAVAPVAEGTTEAVREPVAITPDDVAVEVRGAGNATRQINHIITPEFPADRLELVEVYTPGGNWSSWPPHKHDVDAMPHEAVLEELYHYQFRRAEAWGIQRLYRADRSRDLAWEVRHGDVVLVTDGYHPFVAAHGDDAYYLNALAGDRRTMACTDDPDLAFVRRTWEGMEVDPRIPLVRGAAVASRASVVPASVEEAAGEGEPEPTPAPAEAKPTPEPQMAAEAEVPDAPAEVPQTSAEADATHAPAEVEVPAGT